MEKKKRNYRDIVVEAAKEHGPTASINDISMRVWGSIYRDKIEDVVARLNAAGPKKPKVDPSVIPRTIRNAGEGYVSHIQEYNAYILRTQRKKRRLESGTGSSRTCREYLSPEDGVVTTIEDSHVAERYMIWLARQLGGIAEQVEHFYQTGLLCNVRQDVISNVIANADRIKMLCASAGKRGRTTVRKPRKEEER